MACKRNKEPMQKKSLILQRKKHEWLYSCWNFSWKLDQIGLICVSRNNHISLIWLPITFQTALCPFIEAQREKNWVSAYDWSDFCGFWAAAKNPDLDQIKNDWQKQDKVNDADSAIIFLINILISPSGQRGQVGQFCWGV